MTPGETALRSAAALVGPLPRAVYRLTGEKPLGYLHDVLAQEIASLGAGRGGLAVALSPNGRISAEVRVLPMLDGSVVLDAEPEARAGIEERIGRYAGLAGCELQPIDVKVAALRGPGAGAALAAAGIPMPHEGEAMFVERQGFLAVRVTWGVAGFDLIGDAPEIDAQTATPDELDAARIEAGRPRFGADFDEEVLVNETPLLEHAVSGDKGCYPGQESVAKIRTLGSVRRMLRGLRATQAGLRAGAAVQSNGDLVGTVTSATDLPVAGSAAIALLRSEVAPGATIEAGGTTATVTSLT